MPKSEIVQWSPTFACGIRIIDEQHKTLIDMVNGLFNHVTGDPTSERLYFQKVIHQAVDYVKVHFATEEKIMIQTKFQGYSEHKKAHEAFVLNVVECVRDFEAGKSFTLLNFAKFLKEWILTHIAIMDKQYFTHLKKIATRKGDGKLTITNADVASPVY